MYAWGYNEGHFRSSVSSERGVPSIAAAKKREDECLERGVHGLQRLGQTKLIVIEENTAGSQEEDVHNEIGAE